MPDSVSWKINGLRELDEQLKTMPDKLLKTAMRGAVGAGAKVIQRRCAIASPQHHRRFESGNTLYDLGQSRAGNRGF
jgi:hypothetical protein